MKFPDLYIIGIPIYVLFGTLEWYYVTRKNKQFFAGRDAMINIALFVSGSLIGLIIGGTIFFVWRLLYAHRIFDLQYTPYIFVLIFFVEDFVMYCNHRLQHTIRYLWEMTHVVHHSSEDYNLSTALRNGWMRPFGGLWILWGLLCWIGFPPELVVFQTGVSRIYQFFTHTQQISKLPSWFEFIFVTPSHHRVHHARNEIYIDKNYGGILIIWDRMFGTFQEELQEVPVEYGILAEVDTHSIVDVNFRGLRNIFQDMRRYGIKTLLYPPGWKPDKQKVENT
ncbi:MAG: sterol desaturase family protein [Spirochaetota bacterium]